MQSNLIESRHEFYPKQFNSTEDKVKELQFIAINPSRCRQWLGTRGKAMQRWVSYDHLIAHFDWIAFNKTQNFFQLAYEIEKSLQNVEVRYFFFLFCLLFIVIQIYSSFRWMLFDSNTFLMCLSIKQQEQLMYGEEGTCTLCSKTFARKSSLLTHIRNHTAERKYSCPTCQKSMYIQRMRQTILVFLLIKIAIELTQKND